MVELMPTDLTERKVLQRKQAENEIRIAQNEAKIAANEAEIARNCEEIQRLEEKSLKLSYQLTMYLMLSATVPPLLCLLILSSIIFSFPNIFVDVSTDYGFDAYAETPIWTSLQPIWLSMPGNLLVNLGYIFMGLYWLKRLFLNVKPFMTRQHISCVYLKACFCWTSVYYGFVQAARIVFQNHSLSVLDQWVTLPIFTAAALLCYTIKNGSLSQVMEIICISLSLMSYGLATVFVQGFELALLAHIIIAIWLAVDVCRTLDNNVCWRILLQGVLCCIGFVVLKLLDFYLLEIFVFFKYLSGHFWSKICDILQIHYTLLFIEISQQMFERKAHTN